MEDGIESRLRSPVAFVEGGIQEACDDYCSICLEAFCNSDPSTVTGCKHEFHLQCILEWCQRSSNCPMCWQAISLKDPASQELLEAVEHEKRFTINPTRNSAIFRHPTLGDFELQHLPVGVNEGELEDRIIQHLAAAAAMGRRNHHVGQRSRSMALGQPQFLVFSAHSNAPPAATISAGGGEAEPAGVTLASPSVPPGVEPVQPRSTYEPSIHRNSSSQDRAGPSEFQTITSSWKSRFSAVSMRYKETVSKSTRELKERLFNKSPLISEIGSEVRREVDAGMANVSRMMERLEARENSSHAHDPSPSNDNNTHAARLNAA